MTELYRNEIGTVSVFLPAGSIAVTAQLIKDGVPVSLAGVNYNAVDSIASVELPFSLTALDQEYDIAFGFTIGAEAAVITEHVKVVTPVLSRARGELLAPGRYIDTEPIIRNIIESYTGQNFGKWIGTYTIFGEDDSELQLPGRLISLSALNYSGVAADISSFLIKGDRWFLSKVRNGLTVKEAPPEESVEFVITGGQTIFYPFRGYASFGEDVEYSVTGTWGYEYVPADVIKAAEILFADYVCNEATYRNRYVQEVTAQDWKIKLNGRTWDGTGNVLADQILEKYRRSGMSII